MGIIGLVQLFVIFTIFGLSREDCCCQKKLRDAGIIPTHAECVCTTNILIEYDYAAIGDSTVKCGNMINPSTIETRAPKVTFDARCKCKYATLAFVDLETYEALNPYLHWLAVNINTEDLAKGEIGDDAFVPYHYNTPGFTHTNGTEVPLLKDHHYLAFFVYCQSEKISKEEFPPDSNLVVLHRFPWYPKKFAEENKLGNPVAVNFFDSHIQVADDPTNGSLGKI